MEYLGLAGSHGHAAFHRNRHRAGWMTDSGKMSLGVLDNETKSRAFTLVIYKMPKALAGGDRPSTGL